MVGCQVPGSRNSSFDSVELVGCVQSKAQSGPGPKQNVRLCAFVNMRKFPKPSKPCKKKHVFCHLCMEPD